MSNLTRSLWAAVAVLGLAALAASLPSNAVPSYPVRLATLAAVVAIIGLLPDHGGRGWLVAALAVAGSLDAGCSWLVQHHAGWGEPVTLALSTLQSVAAVAALLTDATTGAARAARSEGDAAQAAYLAYVQAYYYAAQFGQPHPTSGAAAPPSAQEASATGESHGASGELVGADDATFAELEARYGHFRPSHDGPAAQPAEGNRLTGIPGMPGVDAEGRGSRASGRGNSGRSPLERDRRSAPPT